MTELVLNQIVSTKEAAKYLGLSVSALYKWTSPKVDRKGPIEPVKIGGKLGWRVKDLKALVEGQ